MILAGELKDRITLQSRRYTGRDALNAKVFTWANEVNDISAKVEAITGRQSYAANQIQNPVTLQVKMRVGPSVLVSWRVKWWDQSTKVFRYLSIEAVQPSVDRDHLMLLCSEGLNNG